jgi:purine-binding chemotaxis protein CheW
MECHRRDHPAPHLLIFTLDGQRYALPLDKVERVVRAAAITPLPAAPDVVLGVLDIRGEVVAVINLRKRFRHLEREVRGDDQFVIARSRGLTLALAADSAVSVVEQSERAVTAPDEILAGLGYLQGVTRTPDGLVLIHDLESLLSVPEEELLVQALEQVKA